MKRKHLAGYIRVSAVNGREGDKFRSPTDQAAEIQGWAKANGHEITMLPAELDAKSDNPDRVQFRRAIEGVKSGEFDGLVSAYLSRAGRDLRLMLDLWDEVESVGGTVYSARENIDGSTPSGRLQRNLLASIAQHELEERREGFDRARKGAVERGIHSAPAPRGYDKGADRRLVPNGEADSVRKAFADYLGGVAGPTALAKRLKITPQGVRLLLANRAYLGELRQGDYVNSEAHPALIDRVTFEAVQSKLASGVRGPRNRAHTALLTGIVRCASCGHVMTRGGGGRKSNGKRYSYYKCTRHHGGGECPQPANVQEGTLDQYVAEIVAPELAKLVDDGKAGDRVKRAQAHVEKCEAELEAFLDVFTGSIDPKLAKKKAERLQGAVDKARADLRREAESAPAVPEIGPEGIWGLAHSERNTLLRSLLKAVIVKPVGRGARVPMADRVQVVTHQAAFDLPDNGGASHAIPIPITPIWIDSDDPREVGVLRGEKAA